MGKTAFLGPVYGAKATLCNPGPFLFSNATTAAFYTLVVPAYETWYATELSAYSGQATSNSSNVKVQLKVKGTSTSASYPGPGPDPNFPTGNAGTVFAITGPTSTATWVSAQTLPTTPTPGEYEGYGIPANSSVRFVCSGTVGQLTVMLAGFRRFIESTRAS